MKATAIVTVLVEYDDATCSADDIAEKVEGFLDTCVSTDGIWDNCISDALGSPGLGSVSGVRKPDDLWKEDPEFPRAFWGTEAFDGDTLLGYWDWVAAEKQKLEPEQSE
jgi:hypothetical protein